MWLLLLTPLPTASVRYLITPQSSVHLCDLKALVFNLIFFWRKNLLFMQI